MATSLPRADALTTEEKASLTSGESFWESKRIDRVGIPTVITDGAARRAQAGKGGDHLGLGDSVPATCFPPAVALGSSWDAAAAAERVGDALGVGVVDRGWSRGHPRPRRQHQAVAAVRAQLRIPLRGPDRLGRPRRSPRQRHPVHRCRRVAQALRGEQPGERPHALLEPTSTRARCARSTSAASSAWSRTPSRTP